MSVTLFRRGRSQTQPSVITSGKTPEIGRPAANQTLIHHYPQYHDNMASAKDLCESPNNRVEPISRESTTINDHFGRAATGDAPALGCVDTEQLTTIGWLQTIDVSDWLEGILNLFGNHEISSGF